MEEPIEEEKEIQPLISSAHFDDLTTKSYKKRWLVLGSFMLLVVANNVTQFSFSPISDETTAYYGIDPLELDLLALVFMISGFTIRFFAMWLIDNKGLGIGIFTAALANVIGGWLRYFPGSRSNFYGALLAGQIICAIAQSFVDIAGPKIAATWFPPEQRTTATALGQGPIFFAVLLAYAVVPQVVISPERMPDLLLGQAILNTVAAIAVFVFFRGTPPKPPSYSAAAEKQDFKKTALKLLKSLNFLIMLGVFSIALGIALSFAVLMDQIVAGHYDEREASILTVVWVSASCVGGLVGGPLVDKTRAYKRVMLVSCIGTTVFLAGFASFLQFGPKNLAVMCVLIIFVGFGAVGAPAMLEATIETTYPVPEATAMGLLFLGLNITSLLFVFIMQKLKDPQGSMAVSLWFCVGLGFLASVLVVLFKPIYHRLNFEKAMMKRSRHNIAPETIQTQ